MTVQDSTDRPAQSHSVWIAERAQGYADVRDRWPEQGAYEHLLAYYERAAPPDERELTASDVRDLVYLAYNPEDRPVDVVAAAPPLPAGVAVGGGVEEPEPAPEPAPEPTTNAQGGTSRPRYPRTDRGLLDGARKVLSVNLGESKLDRRPMAYEPGAGWTGIRKGDRTFELLFYDMAARVANDEGLAWSVHQRDRYPLLLAACRLNPVDATDRDAQIEAIREWGAAADGAYYKVTDVWRACGLKDRHKGPVNIPPDVSRLIRYALGLDGWTYGSAYLSRKRRPRRLKNPHAKSGGGASS